MHRNYIDACLVVTHCNTFVKSHIDCLINKIFLQTNNSLLINFIYCERIISTISLKYLKKYCSIVFIFTYIWRILYKMHNLWFINLRCVCMYLLQWKFLSLFFLLHEESKFLEKGRKNTEQRYNSDFISSESCCISCCNFMETDFY